MPSVKSYSIQYVSVKPQDLVEARPFNSSRPTSLSLQSSTEGSFIKKLQSSGRSLVVFYGSQTGTGEEFAGRLAKEGVRYRLKGMVADPEESDMVSVRGCQGNGGRAILCAGRAGESEDDSEFAGGLLHGDLRRRRSH